MESVWKGRFQETIEHVKVDALRIAGILKEAGPPPSDATIAVALGVSEEKVTALRSTLLAEDHPLIVRLVRDGIPISAPALPQLNPGLKCRSCGFPLPSVPCVYCACDRLSPAAKQPQLPQPPEPTPCAPGSEGKLQEMQRRVAAGYSPFHDDDAVDFSHTRNIYGRAATPVTPGEHHDEQ